MAERQYEPRRLGDTGRVTGGAPVPRYASVADWCGLSGIGKTTTYALLSAGALKAIKVGKRTLVDVQAGLDWMQSQPAAQFQPPKAVS